MVELWSSGKVSTVRDSSTSISTCDVHFIFNSTLTQIVRVKNISASHFSWEKKTEFPLEDLPKVPHILRETRAKYVYSVSRYEDQLWSSYCRNKNYVIDW